MKNTKKSLSTGITLAVILCALVKVSHTSTSQPWNKSPIQGLEAMKQTTGAWGKPASTQVEQKQLEPTKTQTQTGSITWSPPKPKPAKVNLAVALNPQSTKTTSNDGEIKDIFQKMFLEEIEDASHHGAFWNGNYTLTLTGKKNIDTACGINKELVNSIIANTHDISGDANNQKDIQRKQSALKNYVASI
jgi:hypothetical protein